MLKRPLFKAFGSKWQLSRHYPAPKFDAILEPFAASAAYSLRHYEREVTLIEADPRIAGLWRWLISGPAETIAALPTFAGEEGLDLQRWAREECWPWQAAELVIRWQRVGRNDCPTVSAWNARPGQWDAQTRDYVAESVSKIAHWRCFSCDWELADDLVTEASRTTLFLDPPYKGQPAAVYGASLGAGGYERLRRFCLRDWRQLIVCEQAGASWLPFEPFRDCRVRGHGGKAGRSYREVLYLWPQ